MDEILIEEKKYISSKRAAKITGYAKDYIGQLCREGRVPARLVGRSWYVLESAIADHRFGDEKSTEEMQAGLPKEAAISTWESPHYEASPVEIFPSISRTKAPELPSEEREEDGEHNSGSVIGDSPQQLQDSWRTWFDRAINAEPVVLNTPIQHEEKEEVIDREVNIPIHTIYELPPDDLLPRHPEQEEPLRVAAREKKGSGVLLGIIKTVALVLAIMTATVAVVSTGYFDKYVSSISQVSFITGVTLYIK